MATHKSAEKRARQSVKRNARNSQTLGTVRTWEKKIRTALAGGDAKGAKSMMNDYMSTIASAARKGALHAKTASRKLSRLAARVDKLVASK